MKAIQEFSRSYPLVRNIVLFLVSGIVLQLLRKFVLNRLYVHLKGSSNWHGVRKTAFWINVVLLVIVFLIYLEMIYLGFRLLLVWQGPELLML